jgi:hypothetical protein
MTFNDLYNAACRFFARFVFDAVVLWIIRYYYRRWQKEAEFEISLEETRSEVPLGPGETLASHGERKIALGEVWRAIWSQQKNSREGEECKQWFLDEIKALCVNRYGNAREIQGAVNHKAEEAGYR